MRTTGARRKRPDGATRGRRETCSGVYVVEAYGSQRPFEDPDRIGADAVDGQQLLPRVMCHLFEARDAAGGERAVLPISFGRSPTNRTSGVSAMGQPSDRTAACPRLGRGARRRRYPSRPAVAEVSARMLVRAMPRAWSNVEVAVRTDPRARQVLGDMSAWSRGAWRSAGPSLTAPPERRRVGRRARGRGTSPGRSP